MFAGSYFLFQPPGPNLYLPCLMKQAFLAAFLSFFWSLSLMGQAVTLSGFVYDNSSGEAIIGAVVVAPEKGLGAISNAYGFYSLTLPSGDSVLIRADFPGFQRREIKLLPQAGKRQNLLLEPKELELEEVLITDQKARENVERPTMGVIDLNMEEVELLPAIGGEVDILKVLQLLPGVQSGTEASAGFFVRGGASDQNLILLDEAQLYNPFHLAGFLSVFNSAAIKNVNLYKGSFPAQYGGRLSSILDIVTKEGNMQSYHMEGGIGLIASRLMVEGPILKNRASFMISARRSYLDLLARPLFPFGRTQGYFLQDFNAKVNVRLSDRDRIYLSGYSGQDRYIDETIIPSRDTSRFDLGWGNQTASLRWNHLFSSKLFANTSLIYNRYSNFRNQQFGQRYRFNVESEVQDWTAKVDFDYYPGPRHQIRFGLFYVYHDLTPGRGFSRYPVSETRDTTISNFSKAFTHEAAFYAQDEFILSDRISIQAGLRVPAFVGDDTSYVAWEPRLTMRVGLNENASLKGGYTVMNQYLNQVASSAINNPFDFWLPSSRTILPQRAEQYAVGYFQNFSNDRYEASVELYYKTMTNQIDFAEGVSGLSADYESLLVFGKGWAYGAEWYIRKRSGRLTGWLSYTLSWNWRQFDDLNQGDPFFFRYDRRHDLALVTVYRFNERWSFSSVVVYGTGNAVTLPSGYLSLPAGPGSNNYVDFDRKNAFRMPAYQRLDLGLRYTKPGPKVNQGIHIDIYNALNRRNPFFLYLDTERDIRANATRIIGRQVSLLPMIPTITYVFEF